VATSTPCGASLRELASEIGCSVTAVRKALAKGHTTPHCRTDAEKPGSPAVSRPLGPHSGGQERAGHSRQPTRSPAGTSASSPRPTTPP
jgi:hypothetical protein